MIGKRTDKGEKQLEDYSMQHKKAWEFDAYDFWVRTAGSPQERAAKDKENPEKMLKHDLQ